MIAPKTSQPDRTSLTVRGLYENGYPLEQSYRDLQGLAEEVAGVLPVTARALMAETVNGNCECLIAYHDEQAVGIALVLEGTAGMGERVLWLELMYVRPGITGGAEALRSAAVRLGKARGLRVLFLRWKCGSRTPREIRRVGQIYEMAGG